MPNDLPLLEVQSAVYALLGGDDGVLVVTDGEEELGVDVLDDVPEDAGYPRIVIGEATSTPANAHDRFGHRSTITLHVWSAYHGYREALLIADAIIAELDHEPLEVDGFAVVSLRHEQTVTMRDADPDIRHVPMRFAIETEIPPT